MERSQHNELTPANQLAPVHTKQFSSPHVGLLASPSKGEAREIGAYRTKPPISERLMTADEEIVLARKCASAVRLAEYTFGITCLAAPTAVMIMMMVTAAVLMPTPIPAAAGWILAALFLTVLAQPAYCGCKQLWPAQEKGNRLLKTGTIQDPAAKAILEKALRMRPERLVDDPPREPPFLNVPKIEKYRPLETAEEAAPPNEPLLEAGAG